MNKTDEIISLILYEKKKQGLSSLELAKKAGCTQRYIHYIEIGKRKNIGVNYADKILSALDVNFTIGKK